MITCLDIIQRRNCRMTSPRCQASSHSLVGLILLSVRCTDLVLQKAMYNGKCIIMLVLDFTWCRKLPERHVIMQIFLDYLSFRCLPPFKTSEGKRKKWLLKRSAAAFLPRNSGCNTPSGGKIVLFDLSNVFRVDKWWLICVLETCQVGKHVPVVIFSLNCNVLRNTAIFSALTVSWIELLCWCLCLFQTSVSESVVIELEDESDVHTLTRKRKTVTTWKEVLATQRLS